MLAFPNCKINLGLHITGRRPDGFHHIETLFYPLPVCDALEIIKIDKNEFTFSGLPVAGSVKDNLCFRAYDLLKKDFPELPSVHLHLHKIIPMGAGLGGGSADAAFTLKLLNEKFKLGLSAQQLAGYAVQLGSDCAFFIQNIPCLASGKGEILTPVEFNLAQYSFALIYPGIQVNTAWAYSKIQPATPSYSLKEIIRQPVENWKHLLINDFEIPVFSVYPAIQKLKEQLYNAGAIYAAMSGSGSAVFGIFPKNNIAGLAVKSGYQVFLID